MLAGAQSLYGHTPEATLYTIPGRFFETGDELTPSVRRAVNELVATLEKQFSARAAGGSALSYSAFVIGRSLYSAKTRLKSRPNMTVTGVALGATRRSSGTVDP